MSAADTIFALATAPGRAGVAVLRISGPKAADVLSYLSAPLPAPRQARLLKLISPKTREIIDHALVLWFPAPHSFTGEDVLELHLHGSRAVIQEVSALLLDIPDCRLAEPGEFSRRAFIHGKMDLTAAEGLADLIDAETVSQKRQALRQMSGELESFYNALRKDMVHALALCEAYIDFPDEDIPEEVLSHLRNHIETLRQTIATQLADGERGQKIREGIEIVILGPPNAGKSSLMNALARRDVAIVSSRAGTTRDVIEVHLDIAGYAVTLADTAGLRKSADEIEEEGVRRALAKAENADLRMVMFDVSDWPDLDKAAMEQIDDQSILLLNKADVRPEIEVKMIKGQMPVLISIKENRGLDLLLALITERVTTRFSSMVTPAITRIRHRKALEEAGRHLTHFTEIGALELQCEELRRAARAIGSITGHIDVEQVLDDIFFHFCIGK